MAYKNIIFEQNDALGIIKMNRPEAMNALNTETFEELNSLFDLIEADDKIRVVLVTGEGKAFVAGADIVEMKDMDGQESLTFSRLGQSVFRRMETMEVVFIGVINGFCLGGGCEFAMACDMRIASEKAKFGQPEVNLGVTPGFAGTQRLPRLVGAARAKELLLTGDLIDAETARSIGLANRVVAPENLMAEAESLAQKILKKGPLSVRLVKTAVNRGLQADIDTAGEIESQSFGLCFASGQTREGMSAFLEKRDPNF